jgi:hypothetical protein
MACAYWYETLIPVKVSDPYPSANRSADARAERYLSKR